MNNYMNEEWFAILKREIENSSQCRVADKLGYSHTTVSLILKGKYNGKTDKFSARVIEVYGVVSCPHELQKIPLTLCKETALGKAPTHNPAKMAHWKACQKCAKRPGGDTS